MNSIRDLIADDGYAMSFQSMGQYRTALLKALASGEAPSDKEIDKVFGDNCYTDDYGTYLMQEEEFRVGVRVALSRWCGPSAPPAPGVGEVSELVTFLKQEAEELDYQFEHGPSEKMRRAATLLLQQPAPASEVVQVGVLNISDFRGLENSDFQQLAELPPGRYELFTTPS
jgi:hypothetical protein